MGAEAERGSNRAGVSEEGWGSLSCRKAVMASSHPVQSCEKSVPADSQREGARRISDRAS